MADIDNNLFYHILFSSRIGADRKVETLVEAFNAVAADQTRAEYTELLDHLVERNQEGIRMASMQGPGSGEPNAEKARMNYLLGINHGQQFLFEMLDQACKQGGAVCLEPEQIALTAQILENLKVRNEGLQKLVDNPDGLKEFLAIEAAREQVVTDAPVTVRKSPLKLKK